MKKKKKTADSLRIHAKLWNSYRHNHCSLFQIWSNTCLYSSTLAHHCKPIYLINTSMPAVKPCNLAWHSKSAWLIYSLLLCSPFPWWYAFNIMILWVHKGWKAEAARKLAEAMRSWPHLPFQKFSSVLTHWVSLYNIFFPLFFSRDKASHFVCKSLESHRITARRKVLFSSASSWHCCLHVLLGRKDNSVVGTVYLEEYFTNQWGEMKLLT